MLPTHHGKGGKLAKHNAQKGSFVARIGTGAIVAFLLLAGALSYAVHHLVVAPAFSDDAGTPAPVSSWLGAVTGIPRGAAAVQRMGARPGVQGSEHREPVNRIERFLQQTSCSLNFFLAWTTPPNTFTLRYRRTVESTLKFHPTACMVVYSPTLPVDYFDDFWNMGYNVIVERPDVPHLLKNTPAEAWYRNIERWRVGVHFFSHITEIIRLSTLYKYGGVYLDTDVIVMRDMSSLRNCVGTELSGAHGEAKVLNGAVLVFDKGSRFMWEAMVEYNTTYRIDSWGWNGPELVTRVARRFPQGDELRILPTIAFYPIHWARVRKFFTTDDLPEQHAVWEKMERETFLFHYWNKITKKLVPSPGSLMYKVLNNYCLKCDDTGVDG